MADWTLPAPALQWLPLPERTVFPVLALLLAGLASAAGAETLQSADAPCWAPGAAPGLFSWAGAPGVTCREAAGAAVNDPAPFAVPAPGRVARPTKAPSAPTPGTAISFSGEASIGFVARF